MSRLFIAQSHNNKDMTSCSGTVPVWEQRCGPGGRPNYPNYNYNGRGTRLREQNRRYHRSIRPLLLGLANLTLDRLSRYEATLKYWIAASLKREGPVLGLGRKLTSIANDRPCDLTPIECGSHRYIARRPSISARLGGFLAPLFPKERRHESWHSCIELSRPCPQRSAHLALPWKGSRRRQVRRGRAAQQSFADRLPVTHPIWSCP